MATATPVNLEGDDASSGLRSGVVARGRHRGMWRFVAFGRPGVHAGGSAAALYARCISALLFGNSRRRANYRLHAPAAGAFERGMPQRFRQARAVGVGREVESGHERHLCDIYKVGKEALAPCPPSARCREWWARFRTDPRLLKSRAPRSYVKRRTL